MVVGKLCYCFAVEWKHVRYNNVAYIIEPHLRDISIFELRDEVGIIPSQNILHGRSSR